MNREPQKHPSFRRFTLWQGGLMVVGVLLVGVGFYATWDGPPTMDTSATPVVATMSSTLPPAMAAGVVSPVSGGVTDEETRADALFQREIERVYSDREFQYVSLVAQDWLQALVNHDLPDRALRLQLAREAFAKNPPVAVNVIDVILTEVAPEESTIRVGALSMLTPLMYQLQTQHDLVSKDASRRVIAILDKELALASAVPVNLPEGMTEQARGAYIEQMLHQGRAVLQDGKLMQTTEISQIAVVHMLEQLSGNAGISRLEQLARATGKSAVVSGVAIRELERLKSEGRYTGEIPVVIRNGVARTPL